MNKRIFGLVLFMLIAMLALSAFRWLPSHFSNHLGLSAYHQSERADYVGFFTTQSSVQSGLEADAARYTAMTKFYNADAISTQRGLEADAARYTAMAKYYQSERNSAAMPFHFSPPGR